MKKIYLFLYVFLASLTILIFLSQNRALLSIMPRAMGLVLSGEIYFSLPESFFKDIFLSTGAVLLILFCGKIGSGFIIKKFLIKRKKRYALDFCMGIIILGTIFLLPSVFFFLNRFVVTALLLILVLLYLVWRSRQKKEKNPETYDTGSNKSSWIFFIPFSILTLIIFFNFYHAVLYPETYWDSLIYYLHYGKMTYLQHGFPVMYTAQVGLALGANYPHIYHLVCAVFATLFGHYTDMYGQLLSPVAGLFATMLIYQTGLLLFNDRTKAILIALLFRSIPFTNVYFTYATDYSFVLLYTSGIIYLSALYLKNNERVSLVLLAIFVGALPNINYLGWIFLPVLFAVLFMSWKKKNKETPVPFFRFSFPPILLFFAIAFPWYIRNWIVTGNPVYAFYPEIFGGKKINMEVLESCFKEWTANGIGVPGGTILERLKNAPGWFFGLWQLNPVLFAFTLPGIVYLLISRPKEEKEKYIYRAGYIALSIFALGLFYHIFISNLYLYQIIFILPAMAILSAFAFSEGMDNYNWVKYATLTLVLIVGIIPGLSMSIMGMKDPRPALVSLRYPGLSPERYYRLRFPDESRIWEYINRNLHDTAILSHENRYHVFNDDITIRHLDDWDIQPLYNETDIRKKVQSLYDMGIRYYLFIPNERNHPIVAKLETSEMIEQGYLQPVYQSGEYKLYQFQIQ